MRTVISGNEAPRYITFCVPFKTATRNFSGRGNYEHYEVYSYSTLIAEFYEGVWYLNDTTYSVTTSKHQTFVRWALSNDVLNDRSIHFYHEGMYVSRMYSVPMPAVMTERVARIKAGK